MSTSVSSPSYIASNPFVQRDREYRNYRLALSSPSYVTSRSVKPPSHISPPYRTPTVSPPSICNGKSKNSTSQPLTPLSVSSASNLSPSTPSLSTSTLSPSTPSSSIKFDPSPRSHSKRPPKLLLSEEKQPKTETKQNEVSEEDWGVSEDTDFTPRSHKNSTSSVASDDDEDWDAELPGDLESTSERTDQTDSKAKDFGLRMTALKMMSLPLLRQQISAFFYDVHRRYVYLCAQLDKHPLNCFQTLLRGLERNRQATTDLVTRQNLERNIQVCKKNIKEIMESKSDPNQVVCVAKQKEQFSKFRETLYQCARGFDEHVVSSEERLDALPSTLSNAEGLEVFTRIVQALHSLVDWEGGKSKNAARLTLKFQRYSTTLLEQHHVQQSKWKKDV